MTGEQIKPDERTKLFPHDSLSHTDYTDPSEVMVVGASQVAQLVKVFAMQA